MFKFRLHPLFDEDGGASESSGVEGAGEAALQEGQSTNVETGDQNNPEAGDDKNPPDPNTAWEKRIAKVREKAAQETREALEKEYAERYKDHDAYRKAAEYLQRTSGIGDIMTLKEEIELAELQERAEKEKVPPNVLKRIDELEAKAARGEELEAAQKEEQERQAFENTLKDFCKDKTIDGKSVDHMELWKYMHENTTSNPDVAFKAMKAEILESKLETAKTDAVNEYLQSKQAPKIEGSQGAAAQQAPGRAGSIDAAEQRALARLRAAREAQ